MNELESRNNYQSASPAIKEPWDTPTLVEVDYKETGGGYAGVGEDLGGYS